MQKIQHETFSFGGFTLDTTRGCLLSGAQEIKLRPKSFDVLKYLVENSGRLVTKGELIEAVWPNTFVTDNSLVQCLIEVRRALDDSRQEFIKTVPRRGYIFAAQVSYGEPAALNAISGESGEPLKVFEEAEEIEDRAQDDEIAAAEPVVASRPAKSKRLLLVASIAACAIGISISVPFLARHRVTPAEIRTVPVNSIAVLPLQNLTNDTENEYFADGLTESLITYLSRLDQLKVISRGSVFSFKGKDIDPREVGRRLGVATVLEGSVRTEQGRVRVSVRLASTEDGRVLWSSETNRYALKDILGLQDDVARTVSAGLKGKLAGDEEQKQIRRYTDNPEAYQLYAKGRYFWNKRTEQAMKKSIECFDQAVQIDSNYALAYAGLADSYALLNLYSGRQQGEAFQKARAAALKALEIDETLAEAHTSLAYVKYYFEWDWAGAEREFKRALEINPNYATAHQWYAEYLFYMERFDESIAEINRAYELDPLSLVVNTLLGSPYLYKRQYDKALEKYRKALELDPGFPLAIYCAGLCYAQKSMFVEALKTMGDDNSPNRRTVSAALGYIYGISGKRREAREMLNRMMNVPKQEHFSPYLIGIVHVGLGEKDQALEWLEKAYQERDERMVMVRVDMRLDSLRSDPRFRDLLGRMGLAA